MNSFRYYCPTEFIFGKGVENDVAQYVQKYSKNGVLLHYGGNSAKKSGLLDRIKNALKAAHIRFFELGGVLPNSFDDLVYKGIEMIKESDIDFILAVGGGSVIDSAKAIAVGACYDGDFWDFYERKLEPETCVPLGVVLTLSATGSESSKSSVITKREGMLKRSINTEVIRPKFAIMNPELTMSVPMDHTCYGIVDVLSHVIERYFTSTKDVAFIDRMCESVMIGVMDAAYKLLENPNDYNARAEIMWAGNIAHNDILGLGREQDWASHGIGHELTSLYKDAFHGKTLAIIFPAWMLYVADKSEDNLNRFVQFATRVFDVKLDAFDKRRTAYEGIRRFVKFLKDLHMPVNIDDLGATADDFETIANNMFRGGKSRGSMWVIQKEDVLEILNISLRENLDQKLNSHR